MRTIIFIGALLIAGIVQAQDGFKNIEWENNWFFDKESKMYQESCWNEVSVVENDSIDWVLVMRVIENDLGKLEFLPYDYLLLGRDLQDEIGIYCDGTFVAAGFDKEGSQCTEFEYFLSSYYFCDDTGRGEVGIEMKMK
tara:strand:+ start:2727 stop:3143 length:417 start_codon:yes stop_codon:yes gene_type:complete